MLATFSLEGTVFHLTESEVFWGFFCHEFLTTFTQSLKNPSSNETSSWKCLTNDKLHGKLVLVRFVSTTEGDLDLELLTSADDEIVAVVQVGAVVGLVGFVSPPHHVHIPDVQEVWIDRNTQSRKQAALKCGVKIPRSNEKEKKIM